ncbi:MAG: transcriptional regulator, TetR family [Ilumatobacteraceae bacterium]|nr:transcriptional regulator, TetR family [Ilumatobacteraceae bacterium]
MGLVLTEKGERTRDRILQATAQLVVERGVAALSLDDVRAATKTSKSQLFHYFPDGKAELLCAVKVREAHRILDAQRPAIDHLDSWEAWDAWAALIVEQYAKRIDGCPVAALGQVRAVSADGADPGTELYTGWLGALRSGVESMQRAGLIRADADAERLAMATLATIQGGAGMMQTARSLVPMQAAADAAVGYLRSFATPHTRRSTSRR